MANIDKIIKSKNQPKQTNVAWIDLSGETPNEKHFINGRWVSVGGGGGGSSIVINPDDEATEILNKIKADGTVYDADINGKADKVNTPNIIRLQGQLGHNWLEGLTDEQVSNLRMGDIITVDGNNFGMYKVFYVFGRNGNRITLCDISIMNSVDSDIYYDLLKVDGVYNAVTPISRDVIAREIRELHDTHVSGMNGKALITPNAVYNLGYLTTNINFGLTSMECRKTSAKIWYFSFDIGSTIPQIGLPEGIIWTDSTKTEEVNGEKVPIIEANKHYEVTIMNTNTTGPTISGIYYGTIISADIPQQSNE